MITTVLSYAGLGWLSVVTCLVTDGIPALAWMLATAALGELLLGFVWKKHDPDHAPLRFASAAGLGLGLTSLLGLLLGLAGWLNAPVVWAIGGIPLAIWLWRFYQRHQEIFKESISPILSRWLTARADWHWFFVLLMPLLGIILVGSAVMPGILWKPDDPHPYDVQVYHLQVPREWYELGRIVPLEHNVYSYFPFNVEIQYLLGMHLKGGPWEAMYFAQYISLVYTIVGLCAIYGVVKLLNGRAGATLATVSAGTLPWLAMLGCVAYVESAQFAYTALTLAWLLLAARAEPVAFVRPGAAPIVLAGVMAGLSCGVKFTAVPMLLIASAIACGVVMLAGRVPLARVVRDLAIFGIVGTVFVSPWLVRNAVWSGGNPVFPLAMKLLGSGHFSPTQVERFDIAHAPTERQKTLPPRLVAAKREIFANWKYGFVLWPLAAVALVLRPRDRAAWMLLLVLVQMLICWLAVTHLMSRFFVIAIPVAALMIGTIQLRKVLIAALACISIAAGWGWTNLHPQAANAANLGRLGFFNLREMRWIQTNLLRDAYDSGKKVILAGDSRAFLHQIPMSQLVYRTVFDVDVREGQNVVEAWVGENNLPLDPRRSIVIVDPVEIERLSATYWQIPPLPPEISGPRNESFVYRPQ